jgi:hypothetical protein
MKLFDKEIQKFYNKLENGENFTAKIFLLLDLVTEK